MDEELKKYLDDKFAAIDKKFVDFNGALQQHTVGLTNLINKRADRLEHRCDAICDRIDDLENIIHSVGRRN